MKRAGYRTMFTPGRGRRITSLRHQIRWVNNHIDAGKRNLPTCRSAPL